MRIQDNSENKKMGITIYGVGKMGSQIGAFSLIFLRPQKIILKDLKDLEGDMMDLEHLRNGLGLKTIITEEQSTSDYSIISAGFPNTYSESFYYDNHSLFETNFLIVKEMLNNITQYSPKSKVIMVTNPAIELTKHFKKVYPFLDIYNAERILIKYRNSRAGCGKKILKTKGYTNFAPSYAVIKMIQELEDSKKR